MQQPPRPREKSRPEVDLAWLLVRLIVVNHETNPETVDFGVYSRREMHAKGHTDTDIRRMVTSGYLSNPKPGWYALGTAGESVLTALKKGGALACVSALDVRGYWVAPGNTTKVHFRVSKHSGKTVGECRGHGPRRAITEPVDAAPLALVYAVNCLSEEDWIAVCDSVMNTLGLDVLALQELMPTLPHKVRKLMEKCDPKSQSGTESIVRVRLRALGYLVEVQPRIGDGEERCDLKIGRLRIECDSEAHHLTREAYLNDRRRDRKGLVDGEPTMRLDYGDIMFGWDEVLADIAAVAKKDRHRVRRRVS